MITCTLRYSEPLLREVVRAFVLRSLRGRLGRLYFVAVGLMVIALVSLVLRGERGWLVGFMAAGVLCVVAVVASVFIAHSRNTIGRYKKMRSPEATFACTDQDFTLTSEMGTATMPWSAVQEVWRYPRFWLLVFSPAQFVTLPLECLSAEAQALIRSKTKAR